MSRKVNRPCSDHVSSLCCHHDTVQNATHLGLDVFNDLGWHKHPNNVKVDGDRILGFIK